MRSSILKRPWCSRATGQANATDLSVVGSFHSTRDVHCPWCPLWIASRCLFHLLVTRYGYPHPAYPPVVQEMFSTLPTSLTFSRHQKSNSGARHQRDPLQSKTMDGRTGSRNAATFSPTAFRLWMEWWSFPLAIKKKKKKKKKKKRRRKGNGDGNCRWAVRALIDKAAKSEPRRSWRRRPYENRKCSVAISLIAIRLIDWHNS